MFSNNLLPSIDPPNSNVFEIYNLVLSIHQLVENTDGTIFYDNQALQNICSNVLKMRSFSLDDQNSLISRCMLGQTACHRFPSQQNVDLKKMLVNMVSFPRLHFFVPTISLKDLDLSHMFNRLLQINKFDNLTSVDFRHGQFISQAYLIRGNDLSIQEIESKTKQMQNRNSNFYAKWVPNNILSGVCQVAEKTLKISSTVISNSTAVAELLSIFSKKFKTVFKKKLFLHHYIEDMDEMEFTEAESNMNDLINEYKQYQDLDNDEEDEGA